MAESYYVSIQPHNSNGPLCVIASLQVDACVPNVIIQEFFYPYLEHYNEILTQPIEYADGFLKMPKGPGLGADSTKRPSANARPLTSLTRPAGWASTGSEAAPD